MKHIKKVSLGKATMVEDIMDAVNTCVNDILDAIKKAEEGT